MNKILIDLVQAHNPISEMESEHKKSTLEFLENNENCISQSNLAGHITASAWLITTDRRFVLLTHHRKLSRWLQLGGHVESDTTIQQAALREAKEESGISSITLLSQSIFDIDVHRIPARKDIPTHFHYDLRFLLGTSEMEFCTSEESNELKWVQIAELDRLVSDESMHRMAEKTKLLHTV